MRDFQAILVALKIYMADNKNVKIYDKEVADALGISAVNFATLKRRNSIPFESIIKFCYKEDICCSEVFFD